EEGCELGVCLRPVLSLKPVLSLSVQARDKQDNTGLVWPLVRSGLIKQALELGDICCDRPPPLSYLGQALTSFLGLVRVFEGALHVCDECICSTVVGVLCPLDVWEHRSFRAGG